MRFLAASCVPRPLGSMREGRAVIRDALIDVWPDALSRPLARTPRVATTVFACNPAARLRVPGQLRVSMRRGLDLPARRREQRARNHCVPSGVSFAPKGCRPG